MSKNLIKFNKFVALGVIFFLSIIFSVIQIVRANVPDPGHGWAEVGDSGEPLPLIRGGTGLSSTLDDAVWVGDSSASATARVIPNCSNTTNDKLLYDQATNSFSCGTDQAGGGSSISQEATYTMVSGGRVIATDGVIMDLFNGSGSGKILRVLEVYAYTRNTGNVTGSRSPIELVRTTTVGTGGSSISVGQFDSADSNLPAQITARTAPTGGAAITGGFLGGTRLMTEEASLGTGAPGTFPWLSHYSTVYANNGLSPRQRLVVREGEGVACKWGPAIGTQGLGACAIVFQIGDAYPRELPTYSWESNSAATANKNLIDIFNDGASGKVLKISRIVVYTRPTAAIVGIVTAFEVYRTSSIGTGGSTITADFYDTSNDDVSTKITARDAPTGGAALDGGVILGTVVGTDETADSEYGGFGITTRGSNAQYVWDSSTTKRDLVVRPGEGMVVRTGPQSGISSVVVIVEGFLE
jgi:hypothetical protein